MTKNCTEGIKKTYIMCRVNVGYEQLCYYLTNLINTGLVLQDIADGCVIYRTTEDGREFLKHYYAIMKLIKQEEQHIVEGLFLVKDYSSDECCSSTRKLNKQAMSMLEATGI